jgi:hypothetical protein
VLGAASGGAVVATLVVAGASGRGCVDDASGAGWDAAVAGVPDATGAAGAGAGEAACGSA